MREEVGRQIGLSARKVQVRWRLIGPPPPRMLMSHLDLVPSLLSTRLLQSQLLILSRRISGKRQDVRRANLPP